MNCQFYCKFSSVFLWYYQNIIHFLMSNLLAHIHSNAFVDFSFAQMKHVWCKSWILHKPPRVSLGSLKCLALFLSVAKSLTQEESLLFMGFYEVELFDVS